MEGVRSSLYLLALVLIGITLTIVEIGFGYFQTGDIGVFGKSMPRKFHGSVLDPCTKHTRTYIHVMTGGFNTHVGEWV
jgi:hypothetical protein